MPPDRRARGATVRAVRLARKMLARELADAAGTSRSHIGHIEAGRYRASLDLTASLARKLDVPVDVLTCQVPPIATFRQLARVPADDLAAAIGTTTARLTRIERGSERPTLDEVEAVARRLGVSVDALGYDLPAVAAS